MKTININTGLFALKRCIEALNKRQAILEERKQQEQQENETRQKPLPHVPYQDSKLTMILSSVLGSVNSVDTAVGKLVMIVTIDSDDINAIESIHSLRFAEQVSSIRNIINDSEGDALSSSSHGIGPAGNELSNILSKLDSQIKSLQSKMSEEEKWIVKRIVTRDPIDGREIIKNVTVLTGAEHLHKQIEELVNRRDEIIKRCI